MRVSEYIYTQIHCGRPIEMLVVFLMDILNLVNE